MNTKIGQILIIIVIIGFTIYISTYDDKSIQKETIEPPSINNLTFVDLEIDFELEKIELLAILNNISSNTAEAILRDYLTFKKENNLSTEKVILLLSEKYNLPSQKITSLIFSFKYNVVIEE